MSELSTLLRKIADANKANDLLDEILNLEYVPLPLEDFHALKNEIERVKLDCADLINNLSLTSLGN